MEGNIIINRYFLLLLTIWIVTFILSARIDLKSADNPDKIIPKHEIPTRIVGAFHAIIVTVGGFYCLIYDDHIGIKHPLEFSSWPPFEASSKYALELCCFSSAFFLADCIICCILYEEYGFSFFVHAFTCITGTLFGAFGEFGHVYVCSLFIWEGSTPFLHLRWFLYEFGYKDTIANSLSNLFFAISFIFLRLVIGVPVCIRLAADLNSEQHQQTLSIYVRVIFTCAAIVTSLLNLTWGGKVILTVVKILTKKSKKE